MRTLSLSVSAMHSSQAFSMALYSSFVIKHMAFRSNLTAGIARTLLTSFMYSGASKATYLRRNDLITAILWLMVFAEQPLDLLRKSMKPAM